MEGIQGMLYQAGLYNGRIDGWYGAQTERAVRNWQTQIGALPDGKWGGKTMDATANMLAKVNTADGLDQGNPVVIPNYGAPTNG